MRKKLFRDWFKQQYGALPNNRKRMAAITRQAEAIRDLADAERELDREQYLSASWMDALYGWSAGRNAK